MKNNIIHNHKNLIFHPIIILYIKDYKYIINNEKIIFHIIIKYKKLSWEKIWYIIINKKYLLILYK
jgi:hypothetical protein